MSIVVNIYYSGQGGAARAFAKEMVATKLVDEIRKEEGCLRYEYFFPMDDRETVLLIDEWRDQEAIDLHHKTELMSKISELRKKYDLTMKVERFQPIEVPYADQAYIIHNHKIK